VQGRKDNATVYDGDPVEIALGHEARGASMIHLVDLDGAFSDANSRNRLVLADIVSRLGIPVQFGGGLRKLDDIAKVIQLGVSRVVIGTVAVESPQSLDQALHLFGVDRLVVGIDARAGRVLTRGWEREVELSAVELAKTVASAGIARIIYTDVARDGMLTGVNIEETVAIARGSGLKVTASGGVSSVADIIRLKETGEARVDSVIIGKAIYEGRFTLEEALTAAA
jgi:phosphoribosylformimino-5-aminoimidazole carboxamide ribotide isomerase